MGSSAAATQLDVQALGTNEPFQIRNNAGVSLFRVNAAGNIGVRTTSPVGPIDIRNSANATLLQLSNTGNLSIGNITPTYRLDVNCVQTGIAQPPFRFTNYLGNVNMVCTNSDRVGINVANPDTYGGSLVVGAVGTGANALDMVSTATAGFSNQLRFQSGSGIRHIITDDRTSNKLLINPGVGAGATNILQVNGRLQIGSNASFSGTEIVSIDGKVKIGNQTITSGTHSDATLFVTGKVAAKSCIVTINNWADDVFNQNYKLRDLNELKEFIETNKHLPDVPNESEVCELGINLGDMDSRLLRKIEELTLYLLAQDDKIKQLEKQLIKNKE